ncbi:transcription initiation factor TFIID subunit 3 isoform X1 [Schistocerca nitens]|uniref:transcription initiation factor TFIID subunit 3 isoform X1 n=1 Tax=Schistocerca nitens TaxID=7011 RepID=UPI0021183FE6|nr:transcription initiation factor TFIID subunit 3 isoform X1 [Schistocerca nitens]
MCDEFSRKALKVAVALICQTIGWNSIMSTPLEIMIDLLQRYLVELGRVTHRYAELFGHTQPNLDDLGLAFREMGINLQDMEDYIKNVESVPCHGEIPKFPVPRDSHLNFLKPGSREVVTRPVHVHEHLPPMYPEMEEDEYLLKQSPLSVDTSNNLGSTSPLSSPKSNVFKRPGDPVSLENPVLKRTRMLMEEEGRPLREISSVMMTTSGFLSPAREGKLPESRTPLQPSDSRSNSPQPSSYPMVPPEVKGEKKSKKATQKKAVDAVKKTDKENKKEHRVKELVKSGKGHASDETKVKKLVSMKELSKLKALKPGAVKMSQNLQLAGPSSSNKPGKLPVSKLSAIKTAVPDTQKIMRHVSPVAKLSKPEKVHTATLPQLKLNSPEKSREPTIIEGKLSTEPDKQKLNIFKKISKVKEEKVDRIEKIDRTESADSVMRDSRESSPRLIIDESEMNSRQREARMAQIDDCIDAVIQQGMEIVNEDNNSSHSKLSTPGNDVARGNSLASVTSHQPGSDELYMYDDDLSPPGTPSSTPKTPELPTPSRKAEKMPEVKEKKKKKEKSKTKKESKTKSQKELHSPKKPKIELMDLDSSEKPKTPEAEEPCEIVQPPVFPFFSHFPPTPGLIPPPLGHPLFPRFPLPLGKNLPHPAMPNLPLPPPLLMQPPAEEPEEESPNTPERSSSLSSSGPVPANVKADSPEKVQISSHIIKKTLEKKVKEHRRERKDKAKKKKEKKLKAKKEKGEKRKIKLEKKEKLKEKIKEKKEKKEKRKEKEMQPDHANPSKVPTPKPLLMAAFSHFQREEKSEKPESAVPKITFKLGSGSSCPPSPDESQHRKIVIKSFTKNQDDEEEEEDSEKEQQCSSTEEPVKREPSPELARISALITRPPKTKPSKSNPEKCEDSDSPLECGLKPAESGQPTPALKTIASGPLQDNDGNKVWICPACGGQDDGSPMIGCDDCDAWYHWVCVGIQVPPDENEDWYCRVCIVRKQENIVDKKKKSRKKKVVP